MRECAKVIDAGARNKVEIIGEWREGRGEGGFCGFKECYS